MGAPEVQAPSPMPRGGSIPSAQYRPVKPVPTQLMDQITVCFEEQLYTQAFSLLSSSLSAGHASAQILPAHVPPIEHLALAATLSVHPGLTTRTKDADKHAASDEAASYLRSVQKTVGSHNAGLDKAFRFVPRTQATTLRQPRTKGRPSAHNAANDGGEEAQQSIRSMYAGVEAVWKSAEDFWHVLGWAMNCSVAHKHRWERWKVWLELMLDVLASDLESRVLGGDVEESLLAVYLRPIGEGRNNKRRLMRAVLADGSQKSLAEFDEIWRNEAKLPKSKQDDEKAGMKRKLDLENGDFGDYFDDESELDSPATSMPRSRSATALPVSRSSRQPSATHNDSEEGDTEACGSGDKSSQPAGVDAFGGMDSIKLRQCLLALLIRYCSIAPAAFLDTEDLFDLYTEFLRPLPLPVFQQFVLSSERWLGSNEQSSLNQMLLRPLLTSTAPPYHENALTQRDFEVQFASYAANTTSVVNNAKVSLLVEDLLRLLWRSGGLVYSGKLRKVVERGIQARSDKAAWDGRRKTGVKAAEEEDAALMMECSGERMLACLEMLG